MVHNKYISFHPKAKERIKSFSEDIRYKVGKVLHLLQQGHRLAMPLSRSMPSLGRGASEIRIRGEDGIYRVFYVVESEKEIMVFHAFVKKTQKTPQLEIELGKKRLKELRND